jgi:hypothetical protein
MDGSEPISQSNKPNIKFIQSTVLDIGCNLPAPDRLFDSTVIQGFAANVRNGSSPVL